MSFRSELFSLQLTNSTVTLLRVLLDVCSILIVFIDSEVIVVLLVSSVNTTVCVFKTLTSRQLAEVFWRRSADFTSGRCCRHVRDVVLRPGGDSARSVWWTTRPQEALLFLPHQQSRGWAGLAAGGLRPVSPLRRLRSPVGPCGPGVLSPGHVPLPQKPAPVRVSGRGVQRQAGELDGAPLSVPGSGGADTRSAAAGSGRSSVGHWLVWHRRWLGDGEGEGGGWMGRRRRRRRCEGRWGSGRGSSG